MHKGTIALAAAAFAATATALPAAAQERTKVGVLDCIIEGGMELAVISSKELSCTFQPADDTRPPESYVGVVNRFGLEIGATSERVMRWVVLASTAAEPGAPGSLEGNYVGPSAEVTAGIGGGANVLVSEGSRNLVLQPVSLQVQTGLNLAVGVSGFQLRAAR